LNFPLTNFCNRLHIIRHVQITCQYSYLKADLKQNRNLETIDISISYIYDVL